MDGDGAISQLPGSAPASAPAPRPVVPRIIYESAGRMAPVHVSRGSCGSHGSHDSYGSHGSHGSHGSQGSYGSQGPQQAARPASHGRRRPSATELERRRPSAPTYLVATPRQVDLARRASAQAEGVWSAGCGPPRRTSCGRGSSELGSGASLHVLAERLAQPLPSRRCSLLDERSRRLSRFADESVGLAGAAAAKKRARRLVAGVGLIILVAAVAMVGFSLAMSSRIDEIIRKENEEIYRGLKPVFNQTTTPAGPATGDGR